MVTLILSLAVAAAAVEKNNKLPSWFVDLQDCFLYFFYFALFSRYNIHVFSFCSVLSLIHSQLTYKHMSQYFII